MPFGRRLGLSLFFYIGLVILIHNVSSTRVEKIFIHERGDDEDTSNELKKLPRINLDSSALDELKRAYEGIKDNIPKYTGFFFLDFLFELLKTTIVFLATLLVPPPTIATTPDPVLSSSTTTARTSLNLKN